MKLIIYVLLFTFLLGCESKEKPMLEEIKFLKSKNDSLIKALNEINNKYVFDSISFREIPNRKNSIRLNGSYGLELIVVGYSANKNYFIKYDTIINQKMINPDTLKQSNGGFKFNMSLNEKRNPIKIKMNINNDYGKTEKGTLFDTIIVD